MAGPLIEMLQGLRERRQRRRSGWGGGGSPGMRNIINPLDSQDMADRAQGVDISQAMPSTRLQTTISEPMAESFATSQLPQPVAGRQSEPAPEPQAEPPSPFRTAAGSNAAAAPINKTQCGPEGCYVGPPSGIDVSRFGIPVEPGAVVTRIGPEVISSPGAGQAGMVVTGGATASTTTVPDPGQAWTNFTTNFTRFAEDPRNAQWTTLARTAAEQANQFQQLANASANPSMRHHYGKQAFLFGMEAMNATKAAIMQADAQRREKMATDAMNRNTLSGKMQDITQFLTQYNPQLSPEKKAGAYTGAYRTMVGLPPFATEQEQLADPEYQDALQLARAGDVASIAAANAASGRSAFGTEDDRKQGMEPSFNLARRHYGSMPIQEAATQIQTRFVPLYASELEAINQSRPADQRVSPAELKQQAQRAGIELQSMLYWDQEDAKQARPAAVQAQSPAAQSQTPAPPPAASSATHPYSRQFSMPPAGTGNINRLKRNTQ